MEPTTSSGRSWALLLALLLLAIALRWQFFVGFGVNADDLIYGGMSKELAKRGWEAVDLKFGVNYRLGLSVPLALLFRTVGISDLSFVIYPLLMSLVSIVVVFLLGRRFFGPAVGLTAAALLVTCPFEAVFGSAMIIDIITSALTATTILAFLANRETVGVRGFAYVVLGSAATFLAYMVKEPGLYVLACLGVFTLISIRDWTVVRRDALFYAVVMSLVGATFAADYWLMGDALNRFHVQLPQSGSALGPIRETLLQYPRWIWLRLPDGTRPFGYLFYALLPALLYVTIWKPRQAYVPLLWLLVLVLLLNFLPKQIHPFQVSPRTMRYADAWVAPACILIAATLDDIRRWRRAAFWVCLAALAVTGLLEARMLSHVWNEPHADRNDGGRFLATLPPKPLYSDFWFTARYMFDTKYAPTVDTPYSLQGKTFQTEVIEKDDFTTLWTIPGGYVVTGGARGPDVGLYSVLNLDGHTPPPTWRLVKEFARPLGPYRLEPLRIWEVGPGPAPSG